MADVQTTAFTRDALPSPEGQPRWASDLRAEAFSLYEALPVPSQETEEWRYTDLSTFDLAAHRPLVGGRSAANLDDVAPAVLEGLGDVGERAGLLLQHNATTATHHLSPDLASKGVVFSSLDEALTSHPDVLEKRLNALVPAERTKFTALHAAFRTGGTFLYVPRNLAIDVPLQSLTYVDADRAAVFPSTVIVVEEGADVTFLDRYLSPELDAFSQAVTEIHVGPGARVRYVSLQDWGPGVTHLAVQRAHLDRDATLLSLSVAFGSELSRTEVESVLAAPGATSEMLGVYFTDGEQHFDHRSLQDHAAPHCTSDLLYKGALRDRSRAVYSGLIKVRPGAQKTDAMQTNRNIVLSEGSKADSIPNLEIESNDVRCGHAASVGPISEEELFYLQTRAIPRDEAERLIVKGFFQEVLDRVPFQEVREAVDAAIEDELRRS